MSPQRHQQIQALFEKSNELPINELSACSQPRPRRLQGSQLDQPTEQCLPLVAESRFYYVYDIGFANTADRRAVLTWTPIPHCQTSASRCPFTEAFGASRLSFDIAGIFHLVEMSNEACGPLALSSCCRRRSIVLICLIVDILINELLQLLTLKGTLASAVSNNVTRRYAPWLMSAEPLNFRVTGGSDMIHLRSGSDSPDPNAYLIPVNSMLCSRNEQHWVGPQDWNNVAKPPTKNPRVMLVSSSCSVYPPNTS